MPSTDLLEAMGRYNEELVNAGIMLSGEGLKPSSQGKRVAFDRDDRTVTDFWMWEVMDVDEAVEWVKRSPNPMPGPSEIESRQVFELEDFGDEFTPELREQEERLREELGER